MPLCCYFFRVARSLASVATRAPVGECDRTLTFKTNKRRNLNSGQWATIAVEAEDIMGATTEQVAE